MIRAATIVKPYVATFITIIATAICPLPVRKALTPPCRLPAAVGDPSRARVDMRDTLRCPVVSGRIDESVWRDRRSLATSLGPTIWSAVLAVLLLGGALGHGYVLSYDMV